MEPQVPQSIDAAFAAMPRGLFVPKYSQGEASYDIPLPIGYGQTISQPSTVAEMLEWLDVSPGDRVLDIGSGSGWTTALLSALVGSRGHVDAVEVIPELVELGRSHCQTAGVLNANFHIAGSELGLPSADPYDRILVSASAESFPSQLLAQLKTGGKLVIPVRSDILEITKSSETDHEVITHPGYMFVPLIQN